MQSLKQKISFDQKGVRIASHFLFWGVVYLFFILFFGRSSRDYQTTIVFVSMLFPVAIGTTYLVIYFLIPKYLLKQRYALFFLLIVYLVIITECISMLISFFILIYITDYNIQSIAPASIDVISLVVGLYFVCLIAVAIKEVKRALNMQRKNAELNEIKLETELKLKEAELKILKGQIHPHFLFNTLNNLYGLTLEKSDLAPELVLRLSDLLDYMLYRCNRPRVMLKDELKQIRNYIQLEQIRYGDGLKIDVHTEGDPGNLQIAPMLLFPFVENGFKHGVSKQITNPYILIRIKMDGRDLHFTMANSCSFRSNSEEDYSKGIGLKNVQKRLALLYPESYQLQTQQQEQNFRVEMILKLDAEESLVMKSLTETPN